MKRILFWLAFKVLCLLYQFWNAAEGLINGFIRYVYIPIFHSNLEPNKIVKDISSLEKKPNEQLTLVYQIKASRPNDIRRSAAAIARHIKIVGQAVNPSSLNCYLDTSFIKEVEGQDLKNIIKEMVTDSTKLNLLLPSDFNYKEKINLQKKKCTPLVIVFSTYPSVLALHPSFLVGAEIAFRPQVLRSTDYDLYSSLQAYAASEQRKGK